MATIAGLYGLALTVPNLPEVAEFYRSSWGMEQLEAGAQRCAFRSRLSDHADLILEAGSGPSGLAHLAFRVADAAQLKAVLRDAGRRDASAVDVGKPSDSADSVESMTSHASILDPDGNQLRFIIAQGTTARSAPMRTAGAVGPDRLGHVVLWTPQPEVMEAFYARLGLRVSDRTAVGMSFLRCNTDHHSLALVRSKGRTGLQHIAYDVGTLDAVMREKGRLARAGVECFWGMGRHGPGNNVFTYYRDPAGNIVEFYGEMQQVAADTEIGEPVWWGPEHRGDIWDHAGPAPADFRAG